jgi:hypothetical protein
VHIRGVLHLTVNSGMPHFDTSLILEIDLQWKCVASSP